jgi:hypothetical protein
MVQSFHQAFFHWVAMNVPQPPYRRWVSALGPCGLLAGVYYVTLLLDGQPVVKKAVKVSR